MFHFDTVFESSVKVESLDGVNGRVTKAWQRRTWNLFENRTYNEFHIFRRFAVYHSLVEYSCERKASIAQQMGIFPLAPFQYFCDSGAIGHQRTKNFSLKTLKRELRRSEKKTRNGALQTIVVLVASRFWREDVSKTQQVLT